LIGRIRGVLLEKQAPALLVDVQGVAYELEASMSTFYHLPECGETITLHTHLVVREDAHLLYGFASLSERVMFRSLIKISGVTILSGISAEEFTRCIMEGDSKALTQLPGVGKKTAERLVVELKDKLDAADSGIGLPKASVTTALQDNPVNDAVSALISLGYKAQQASQMVRNLDIEGKSTEDIIRAALQGNG